MVDTTLHTGINPERHVWIHPEGSWGIALGRSDHGYLVEKSPGKDPEFWLTNGATATIAAEDFGARMDAIDQTKDWVPRVLVGYLRSQDIPVPN